MAPKKDPEFDVLDQKLKSYHKKSDGPIDTEIRKQTSQAYRMGTELVAGVLVGSVFGFGFDWLLGSKPWFMIIFLIIGFIAGIRNCVVQVTRMQDDMERAQKSESEK